jgi:hypothetical protein
MNDFVVNAALGDEGYLAGTSGTIVTALLPLDGSVGLSLKDHQFAIIEKVSELIPEGYIKYQVFLRPITGLPNSAIIFLNKSFNGSNKTCR